MLPVQVLAGIKMVAIAAGRYHTMALDAGGRVWVWGWNNEGQIGDGTTNNKWNPVIVNGVSDIVAIAAGEYHSIAVKKDGTMWAWGNNAQGQLGVGNFANQYTPVQVSTKASAISLSAGIHTQFTTTAAGMHLYWSSGNNYYGQVGDSTQINRNVPVLVHFPTDENNNGIPDWKEYYNFITSDTDKDGITDWAEVNMYGTDPYNFDSNGDGLADGINVFTGLGVLFADTDGDGISNMMEMMKGTSPLLADTDGDGVPDNADLFPLDRLRKALPAQNPSDHTPPVITLTEPF